MCALLREPAVVSIPARSRRDGSGCNTRRRRPCRSGARWATRGRGTLRCSARLDRACLIAERIVEICLWLLVRVPADERSPRSRDPRGRGSGGRVARRGGVRSHGRASEPHVYQRCWTVSPSAKKLVGRGRVLRWVPLRARDPELDRLPHVPAWAAGRAARRFDQATARTCSPKSSSSWLEAGRWPARSAL